MLLLSSEKSRFYAWYYFENTAKYMRTKILIFSDWIRLYKMSSGHAILAPTDQDIRQMIAAKVI